MKKRNKKTNPPGKFQAWAYSKNHEPKIFKHLAEMLDDFVIVLDRKCNLVSAHGRWLKRYGSSLAQYYGQPIMDSVDRSSKAVAASALRKALSGRTTRCVIFHEKELRWLAVNLSPLKDTRGKINRILGLGYDITELKEKEDRFKVATNRESEFTCAFRCGKDGAIRRIWHVGNFFRLTGTHLSKIRNISILPELIHQASSAEWERFIAELKAGHIAKTEICVLHSRRDVVWIEVTMRPLFLGSCLTGGIFTLRDMTERRMAQQVVLDRQMQYRFLVENASDMIFTLNIDGRNLFVSPSVEHRLGYKPSEMVDRLCFDFIHPEDAAKSRDAMRRAVERPQDRHSILIRMKDKLGVWRVLEIVGKFLPQQDGSAVFIISGRDLTERLISDRRRHLLEEAVQSVEEGILILEKSESLKPVFANKGFQNTLGLGVTVLVEKGLETLRGRGNEPGRWEEMMDHLESGDTWVGELIFRDDAGHNLDGLVEVRAIRGVDGLASGRVVTIRDITETKRAQELLLKYERLATVGEVSAGIAHEIRNPLAVIRLMTQGLQERLGDREEAEEIEGILGQCDRLSLLAQQTLNFQSPVAVRRETVQLGVVAEAALAQAKLLYGPSHEKVVVQMGNSSQWPKIQGDGERLARLLSNLLLNAYQAMPNGGRLDFNSETRGHQVVIRVRNNGEPLEEKNMARIFEPFFTTKMQGSGLGLSICRRITEDHGGVLEARNTKEGVVFEVCLPMDEEPQR